MIEKRDNSSLDQKVETTSDFQQDRKYNPTQNPLWDNIVKRYGRGYSELSPLGQNAGDCIFPY
ncbi:MAG: hypothetical protein ABIH82_04695 [Candidatus Woesearchaeota archaeon]